MTLTQHFPPRPTAARWLQLQSKYTRFHPSRLPRCVLPPKRTPKLSSCIVLWAILRAILFWAFLLGLSFSDILLGLYLRVRGTFAFGCPRGFLPLAALGVSCLWLPQGFLLPLAALGVSCLWRSLMFEVRFWRSLLTCACSALPLCRRAVSAPQPRGSCRVVRPGGAALSCGLALPHCRRAMSAL